MAIQHVLWSVHGRDVVLETIVLFSRPEFCGLHLGTCGPGPDLQNILGKILSLS